MYSVHCTLYNVHCTTHRYCDAKTYFEQDELHFHPNFTACFMCVLFFGAVDRTVCKFEIFDSFIERVVAPRAP